jgi:CIC family chloride channel protein
MASHYNNEIARLDPMPRYKAYTLANFREIPQLAALGGTGPCFGGRGVNPPPSTIESPEGRVVRLTAMIRHRRRLLPQAILLGVLTGLLAVGFHVTLDAAEIWRGQIIRWAAGQGESGPYWLLAWSVGGVFLGAWLVSRWAPEAAGGGIPHLKAVLLGHRRFRWFWVLLVKFVSGVAGMAAGLALGRGGPTVHMGGAIGQGFAAGLNASGEDRHILTTAGGGAGLAATFNTPLAGLVFLLEELDWRATSPGFFCAALACLSADMVCRAILGQFPMFCLTVAASPSLELFPMLILINSKNYKLCDTEHECHFGTFE